ncbi:MAG: ABC transporter ATP-binding protein [Phycisphaerales bacterium]|nr:ABC transporter ATP-binding protein [Phycisphaerales bacterium]
MNMNVIETQSLIKTYGSIQALAGLNLEVPKGSIFGFLGPNGAGKTTTLRILVGLLRSTTGRATVFGKDVWRDSKVICSNVGYLPGDVRFHDWMTGRAYLSFCDQARGNGAMAEIERLQSRFDLHLNRRIRDYSRGMKQKLGLMQALMHRPDLLILDEPGTALDPLVQQTLYEELRAVAADGRTVLFSSHTLSEVEQLCDRVAIIRGGRLIESGTIAALRERAVRRVEFRLKGGDPARLAYPEGFDAHVGGDGVVTATWKGEVDRLLSWLATVKLADVSIGPPSLEDLFAAYYREDHDT